MLILSTFQFYCWKSGHLSHERKQNSNLTNKLQYINAQFNYHFRSLHYSLSHQWFRSIATKSIRILASFPLSSLPTLQPPWPLLFLELTGNTLALGIFTCSSTCLKPSPAYKHTYVWLTLTFLSSTYSNVTLINAYPHHPTWIYRYVLPHETSDSTVFLFSLMYHFLI